MIKRPPSSNGVCPAANRYRALILNDNRAGLTALDTHALQICYLAFHGAPPCSIAVIPFEVSLKRDDHEAALNQRLGEVPDRKSSLTHHPIGEEQNDRDGFEDKRRLTPEPCEGTCPIRAPS